MQLHDLRPRVRKLSVPLPWAPLKGLLWDARGQAIDVRRVGRELGVRYVLEGSVRKAGVQVRIATQLIETEA